MMLMTAVIPSLERLKQEGETGRAKIIQYSRYMTVVICIIQGWFAGQGVRASRAVCSPGSAGFWCANPGIRL